MTPCIRLWHDRHSVAGSVVASLEQEVENHAYQHARMEPTYYACSHVGTERSPVRSDPMRRNAIREPASEPASGYTAMSSGVVGRGRRWTASIHFFA